MLEVDGEFVGGMVIAAAINLIELISISNYLVLFLINADSVCLGILQHDLKWARMFISVDLPTLLLF